MIRRLALCAGLSLAVSACVTHQTGPATDLPNVAAGYKPDIQTDEAGIWMLTDKAEDAVRTSGNRILAPEINALVQEMVCALAGENCPDLRVYVTRVAEFNASASPNGMIQIQSGLLIRSRTESELAAVVGHEITHYIRRHSLARMRNARDTEAVMTLLGLGGTALTGSSITYNNFKLIGQGGMAAFSRDNEREADLLGLQRMVAAGYDPAAPADVWKRVRDLEKARKELNLESVDEASWRVYLASHPQDQDREEYLRKAAAQFPTPAKAPNRLRAALVPIRLDFLMDEVRKGHFRETKALIEVLLPDDPAPGQLLYAMGELHRKRGKEDDEILALSYFHDACEAVGAPPEAFRMVGTLRWRRGEKEMAKEFFQRYLKAAPNAGDREMIAHYLGS